MQRTASEAFPVPTASDAVPAEIVGRLVEAYRPLHIYLFGSAARADAGPDSEYDLVVVAPDDSPADSLKSRKGCRDLRDLGVPRDVFVARARDFESQLHLKASFPSAADEAVKTGRSGSNTLGGLIRATLADGCGL